MSVQRPHRIGIAPGAQLLSILTPTLCRALDRVQRALFVLVFTTFFLFEVAPRQKIHPFQYLMVGAALCLFYLGLISISEFLGFGWAYLIAALAATGLITWYCRYFWAAGCGR